MESQAFTALVHEHLSLVRRVAGAYARTPADREDLVQEILLRLWRSRRRYDPARGATTWFYRVGLNVAISRCRREQHRGRVEPLDDVAEPDAGPEDAEVQLLHECIAELGELERGLVLLHLDGNDHVTIAEVLGISVSNVGTKLSRVRQTLKRALERRGRER